MPLEVTFWIIPFLARTVNVLLGYLFCCLEKGSKDKLGNCSNQDVSQKHHLCCRRWKHPDCCNKNHIGNQRHTKQLHLLTERICFEPLDKFRLAPCLCFLLRLNLIQLLHHLSQGFSQPTFLPFSRNNTPTNIETSLKNHFLLVPLSPCFQLLKAGQTT